MDPGTSALVTTGSLEPNYFLTARANSPTTNPKNRVNPPSAIMWWRSDRQTTCMATLAFVGGLNQLPSTLQPR
jgi:hypothetical protein